MKKSRPWLLLPFVIGIAAGIRLRAHACECVPDGFWVLERALVEPGDAAIWPQDGHVYPDRVSLWGPGQNLNLRYTP